MIHQPIPTFKVQKDSQVFYAGVKQIGTTYYINGGRVAIYVQGGQSLEEAAAKLYNSLAKVEMINLFYSKDIGHQKIKYSFK